MASTDEICVLKYQFELLNIIWALIAIKYEYEIELTKNYFCYSLKCHWYDWIDLLLPYFIFTFNRNISEHYLAWCIKKNFMNFQKGAWQQPVILAIHILLRFHAEKLCTCNFLVSIVEYHQVSTRINNYI